MEFSIVLDHRDILELVLPPLIRENVDNERVVTRLVEGLKNCAGKELSGAELASTIYDLLQQAYQEYEIDADTVIRLLSQASYWLSGIIPDADVRKELKQYLRRFEQSRKQTH